MPTELAEHLVFLALSEPMKPPALAVGRSHRVRVMVQGQVHDLVEGLNDVQIKILRLFGDEVCRLYQISPG